MTITDQPLDDGVDVTATFQTREPRSDTPAAAGVGGSGWMGSVAAAARVLVMLSLLAVVSVSVPASVSRAEPGGATPGSGRGAAAVISAGDIYSCALLQNGTVKCWGYNVDGQLGQGDSAPRGDGANEMGNNLAPIDLGTGRTATAITAGGFHACALLDDASVKCWGNNFVGQLGQGDIESRGDGIDEMGDNLAPVNFGAGRTATAITGGKGHTCGLLDDGTVKCWGYNVDGQLGQGDVENRGDGPGELGDNLAPVDLGTGRTATAITAGGFHACALLDDASVKCWGGNSYGQLGQSDDTTRGDGAGELSDNLAAIDLGTGRTATAITAGEVHTCALLDNSTVKCWGNSLFGQLGQGDDTTRGDGAGELGHNLAAIDLGTGRTAIAITAGELHTCVLLDNRTVKCWGYNGLGQLGYGDVSNRGDGPNEMGNALDPVDLGSARTATAVAAGAFHMCALLDNGTVKCWGNNEYGVLGQGDTSYRGDGPDEMGDKLPPVSLHSSLIVAPVDAAPATPSGVSAAAGPASARLVWLAPSDDGGRPVVGYRIESSIDAVSWATMVADTGSVATSYTVSGLAAGVPVRLRVAAINAIGVSPPTLPSAPVTPLVDVAALTPARLLDTRSPNSTIDGTGSGGGPAAAGSITEIQVAGRGGVPADAAAAALNVTVTGPTADGFATVFPCGQPVPNASNLNYRTGIDIANTAIVKLGASGKACIYTFATTHLVADVNGHIAAAASIATLTPARLLDTRTPNSTIDGIGAGAGLAAAGSITEVQVAGRGGAPANAAAAVLNVTVTGPTADAFATVFPCGQPVPNASNLNYRAGVDIANAAIVRLGAGGKACIYTFAATHFLVDVDGYISANTASSSVGTLNPARLLDTRGPNSTVDGAGAGAGLAAAGSITEVQVAGRGSVPADADAAVLNVTIAGPTADAFATVFPCGQPVPTASNVNYRAGTDIANTAIVKLDDTGKACIYTFATTHLIADVTGHITI